MRTGTWRARGIAWGCVLAWHAVVGWWLLHALPRMSSRGDGDDALQVVYVSLPPLPAPSPRASEMVPVRRSRPADRARNARRQARPATTTGTTATATGSTLQVVAVAPAAAATAPPNLLERAREQARRQAAATAPAADIFANRPARLPQADAGRFRMRTPLSVARVVEAVSAELFHPPGYEADPCPRNRRNIAGLIAAGDSPRLQLELAFEREHCRP